MGQDERHVHFIFFIGLFVFFLAGLAFPVLLNAIRIDEGWSQFLGHQRTAEDKRGNKRGSWQIRVWHWDAVLFGSSGLGSPCEWRGGARHCSRAMVGESGLETC